MKKLKYLFITLLLLPITGKAAVYHCSAPSSVESGETISVTISGSLSSSSTTWSGLIVGEGNASYASGELSIWADGPSFSRTVYFTAGNPGSATFYVGNIDVSDENQEYTGSDTCTVNITSASRPNGVGANVYDAGNNSNNNDQVEVDPDKSANNSLKSLSVEGAKINPAFNKDKLEYTLVVPGNKEKINITGEVEDEKATIEGLGEKELKEGINKFEIKVTAENGVSKTYVITITRKEKDPIEVTINKKKYTVAKKEIGLKAPNGFTKTTVVIDKQEVVGYSNSFTGYLIVALVDEEGNAGWYIYNQKNGSYTRYSELKSNGVRLIIIEPKKKQIPYKYKKYKVEINGEIVDGYALEYGSDYRLVYALNMDTGEKAFYLYDLKENTFQRFYNKQVGIYRDLLKKLEIVLIGLAAIILIMFIVIISQTIVNRKTKKIIKNGGKKEEEVELEDEEEQEEKREELKNKIKQQSEDVDKKKLELARTRRMPKPIVEEQESLNPDDTLFGLQRPMKKEETDTFRIPVKTPVEEETKEEEPLTREEIKRRKRKEKEELEAMRRDFFDL